MDIKQIIEQVFATNMGNRITPELAAGMVRSIAVAIAGSIQQADAQEPIQEAQEVGDGMA
ncbi:hypothetical protein [Alcaligenes endophyticus]|uniref:Uncharacterized protein n=1 Tax=Alcaligenes endophyticus TaxID=1929088 RepID=A0ABT8ENI6_9BURK|nr:hypothetical protein [Alcaligenes endophyticus]MDN4122829.1 hypothetical protein [Alcaligenes endophyticus]